MTTSPRSPYASPNPHRLYRDTRHGAILGVCAGIAEYFGISVVAVRLLAAAGLLFFTLPVGLGYLLAALVVPRRPPHLYRNADEEEFWRTVSTKPDRTVVGLGTRFRDLERRLAGLETYVTSKEYELNRAFRDLNR